MRQKKLRLYFRLLGSWLYPSIIAMFFICHYSCTKKKAAPPNEQPITETSIPTLTPNPLPNSTITINPTPTIGIQIGDIAPDLNLQDTSGSFIKLSTLRGKLVLLDFWASWCAPCKNENKKLVNVYKVYKDTSFKSSSGFEIFMVSVFEYKKEHWISELRKQKYNWKFNVYDEGGAATYLYDVKSVPKNFLLNSEGVIIARDLRDTMVEKSLIQLLK